MLRRILLLIIFTLILPAGLACAARNDVAHRCAPRGIPEAKLIATLQSDAPWLEKQQACRELQVVGTRACVPALAALLTDEKLSHMALLALEPMPGEPAGSALRRAVAKTSGPIKANIITSLGRRCDEAAVDMLIALLKEQDEQVRAATLNALAQIGTPAAAKAIDDYRRHATGKARLAAARASLRVASRLVDRGQAQQAAAIDTALLSASLPVQFHLGAFKGLLRAEPDQAARRLRQAIAGNDRLMMLTAIDALRRFPDARTVDTLAADLPQLPPRAQAPMLEALADQPDPAVRQAVLATGRAAQDPTVRIAAVKTIGRIGDDNGADWLIELLADPSLKPDQRTAVEQAMVMIRAPHASEKLIAAMNTAPPALRSEWIGLIARRGDDSAADALLQQAGQSDPSTAQAAIKALALLAGEQHLPALMNLVRTVKTEALRTAAVQAVVMVARNAGAQSRCTPLVEKAYRQADSAVLRSSLLHIAGALPDARTLAILTDALDKDPDATCRDTALRQLIDWPDPAALATLEKVVEKTTHPTHRILALRGLVRLAGMDSVPADRQLAVFRNALRHADKPGLLKLVLGGLGKVHSPAALAVIQPYLDRPAVHAEAQAAIDQIIAHLPARKLFNGKTLKGWQGDKKWFSVKDGAIIAGRLDRKIPHNEFLATTKSYADFELTLKVKLSDPNANGGVQIRSRRIPDDTEMIGYQADLGQQYWGCLYDESRRRKVLAGLPWAQRKKAVKANDWNDYRIRCLGGRITLWLNGVQTVDYTETDATIEQAGLIGLQVHAGSPAQIRYKDIAIKILTP